MNYQMLIVDDERIAIEGVKSDLDINKLNIDRLFTALNSRQAKEILESESIDILLCDIEMPQSSGLELLAWVREHSLSTVTIFLTSHADFKYAKEALQLGSIEYLLKPVLANDLEKAIRKAQDVIIQHGESNRNRLSHGLWMKYHSIIIEHFWLDLINHTLPSNKAVIREHVEHQRIPITEGSIFLPVLISVKHWNRTLEPRDEKILEYAMKKTAEEMMLGQDNGIVFHLERDQLLALYVSDRQKQWNYEQIHEVCQQYIDFCSQHFYCVLACYVGQPVEVHQMAAKVASLKQNDHDNVAFLNQVFEEKEILDSEESIDLPELNIWLSYLKRGKKEDVIRAVEAFLERLVQNRMIDARILHQYSQDFKQALYAYLITNKIQAHQLFGDERSRLLTKLAGRSIPDLMEWVHHAVDKALHQTEVVKESDLIVQTIQRYVVAHIDEDLSRETLAEQVFMHPDHLTRIFKKETGYSLFDYVMLERIKLAKQLLAQTNISISEIAASVGYSNFSHFTKIFKMYVEIGPSDYRNRYCKK